MMNSHSGLRKKIEGAIGRQILLQYCQIRDESFGPIMIPPIPDSKFVDKLPKDMVLQGQDGYEAEVKVFRCFEELRRKVIILHQLEYTHEQYSAFLPCHPCNQKKCKKGSNEHQCHQPKANIDGETDFVVLGQNENFAAVFEVKGLSVEKFETCGPELISGCSIQKNGKSSTVQNHNAAKFEGCRDDSLRQRKRMVNLIKSLDSTVVVYEFTVFSNISRKDVDEEYSSDKTLLFSEDLNNMTEWFDMNIPPPTSHENESSLSEVVKHCLLGLWCINQENKWELTDCSVSKCIIDTDERLKRALVTQTSVIEAKQNQDPRKRKGKEKAHLKSPEMVEAPKIFEDYLNISCLTMDQLDIFNNDQRFLWVEGPAGSGKTITLLGKIVHLALNTAVEERILLILPGGTSINPVAENHLNLLNRITTCEVIKYSYSEGDGNINDKLDEASRLLAQKLSKSTSKIVLLTIEETLAKSLHNVMKTFDYIFVDDYQLLIDRFHIDNMRDAGCADFNDIISEGLTPIVKDSETNSSSIWILCDLAQTHIDKFSHLLETEVGATAVEGEFISQFENFFELSINLRNAYEISTVMSILRERYEKMGFAGGRPVSLPPQQSGNFIRGAKPTIYILRPNETKTWRNILSKELDKLRGPDSCLRNKDIAVLLSGGYDHIEYSLESVNDLLEEWNTAADKITTLRTGFCMSAEWPAVIYIWPHEAFGSYRTTTILSNDIREEITFSYTTPCLYTALSRARVYSTVILFNYLPNTCEYTDKILEDLRQRPDVCRIVEQ